MRLTYIILMVCLSFCLNAQDWNWENVNLQGMGFVTGIVAHPSQRNLVYARTDAGGVFRWNNSQSNWVPLMDGKNIGYAVESVAVDPKNPNLVYAYVGNKENGVLYKSSNKGNSWLPLKLNVYTEGNGKWRHAGERLSVSGNLIYYASIRDGLWKSTDEGLNWNQISLNKVPRGIDGGQAFVVVHPFKNKIVYVGVQGNGIYKTVDGGNNWSKLSGGPTIKYKPIHAAISNDGILYITYSTGPAANEQGKVYKYKGQGNLVDVTPDYKESQGFAGISVDPKNANIVMTFQWNFGQKKGIHRSVNGGQTWAPLKFDNLTNVVEPAYYPSWSSFSNAGQILIDPKDPDRAWLTTGFAVYQTINRSSNTPQWKAVNKNLEEFVCITVKSLESQPTEMILGVADMVGMPLNKFDEVPEYKFNPDQFGIMTSISYCREKPQNIAFVGSTQYGSLDAYTGISNNGGRTWKKIKQVPKDFQNGNIVFSSKNPKNLVWAPMSQSNLGLPTDDKQLDIHYTLDQGKTWRKSSGGPARVESLRQYWFASESLVADPLSGSTFYLYDRGDIYRSTDNGANWSIIGNIPIDYYRIIMKARPNTSELYFVNKNGGNLYRSLDKGKTWQKVPSIINCTNFAFGGDFNQNGIADLYVVGTINGVNDIYVSDDLGKNWQRLNVSTRLPLDIVTSMDASKDVSGKLYFGTSGRGAFVGVKDEIQHPIQRTYANNGSNWVVKDETIIEAENYDLGGQNVSYYDKDAQNRGGEYRNDRVDIQGISGHNDKYNVGWMEDDEWLEYTIDTERDDYDIIIRAASDFSSSGRVRIKIDQDVIGIVNIDSTGGWNIFEPFKLNNVSIAKGKNKILRLEILEGNFNIDKIIFRSKDFKPLVVRAKGDTGNEKFRINVDGVPIPNTGRRVTSQFKNYYYHIKPGSQLQVEYLNDGIDTDGRDRNLRIDKLSIDGKMFQAEEQNINTGSWNRQTQSCGGVSSEYLYCSGYIEFDLVSARKNEAYKVVHITKDLLGIYGSKKLNSNKNQLSQIKVLDSYGRLVKEFDKNMLQIEENKTSLFYKELNISNLTSGLYFLLLKDENEAYESIKFIK